MTGRLILFIARTVLIWVLVMALALVVLGGHPTGKVTTLEHWPTVQVVP